MTNKAIQSCGEQKKFYFCFSNPKRNTVKKFMQILLVDDGAGGFALFWIICALTFLVSLVCLSMPS